MSCADDKSMPCGSHAHALNPSPPAVSSALRGGAANSDDTRSPSHGLEVVRTQSHTAGGGSVLVPSSSQLRVAGSLTLTSKGVARVNDGKRPVGTVAIVAPSVLRNATPLLHGRESSPGRPRETAECDGTHQTTAPSRALMGAKARLPCGSASLRGVCMTEKGTSREVTATPPA